MQAKAASAFPTFPVKNPRTPQIKSSIVVAVFNSSVLPLLLPAEASEMRLPQLMPMATSSSKIIENLFI
jgi:hypothetical protein